MENLYLLKGNTSTDHKTVRKDHHGKSKNLQFSINYKLIKTIIWMKSLINKVN